MKRTILIVLMVAAGCAYSVPALSWGQKGHRIIAKIAYDHLSKKARKQVDQTLGKQGMIYWSNWPDEIRSDTIYPNSFDWHFQDFNGGLSDSTVVAALSDYPQEGGNLFRALDELKASFRADKSQASMRTGKEQAAADGGENSPQNRLVRSDMPKADMLKFIVHLSGDRFCPMHTAHMDDLGGNRVKMQWFGRETRLHTVWDTDLIESQGYSFTEYAEKLETEYAQDKKAIEQMSDAELLMNNYRFTEAIYAYQQTWDGNTYHYIYRWRGPMERQLYIAGIRLAMILNEISRK